MSYFDSFSDGLFRTDSEGRNVFYPYGIFGKGYVLPSDAKKQEVKIFIRWWHKISLIAILGVGAVVGWRFTVIVLPVSLSWYYLITRQLLRELPTAAGRLTLHESYKNLAHAHTSKVWDFR